jgi:hypothetical protein
MIFVQIRPQDKLFHKYNGITTSFKRLLLIRLTQNNVAYCLEDNKYASAEKRNFLKNQIQVEPHSETLDFQESAAPSLHPNRDLENQVFPNLP